MLFEFGAESIHILESHTSKVESNIIAAAIEFYELKESVDVMSSKEYT